MPEATQGRKRPPPIVLDLCPSCPVRQECGEFGRASGSSGWWGGRYIAPFRNRPLTQARADRLRLEYAEGARTQQQLADDEGLALDTLKGVLKGARWTAPPVILTGEDHPTHRLSREDVVEIRRRLAAGESQPSIAADFEVSRTAICNIGTGRRWSSVT